MFQNWRFDMNAASRRRGKPTKLPSFAAPSDPPPPPFSPDLSPEDPARARVGRKRVRAEPMLDAPAAPPPPPPAAGNSAAAAEELHAYVLAVRSECERLLARSHANAPTSSLVALLRTASGLPPVEARALAESLPAGFGLRDTLIDLLPRVAHASQAKVSA